MATKNGKSPPRTDTTPRPPANPQLDGEEHHLRDAISKKRVELGVPEHTAQPAMPQVTLPPPDDERVERARQQDTELERRRRSASFQSFVSERGGRYGDCRLENFTIYEDDAAGKLQRQSIAKLTEYANDMPTRVSGGANIVLLGPCGTGKDHLLAAMIRIAIRDHGLGVEWTTATRWFARVRASFDGSREYAAELESRYRTCDVLAISDIAPPGAALSDFQTALLHDVLDERYSHRRPTWITANLADKSDADNRLSTQVVDRLQHDSVVIRCAWRSFREGQ